MIRVVSFNLLGCKSFWFEERAEATLRGLRRLAPDILCLQEATIVHAPGLENEGRIHNQARAVAEALGLQGCAFAPYGNPVELASVEQGGVAIASRWPFRSVRNRKLPGGTIRPPDARVGLIAVVDTPLGEITVANTHLSWQPAESELRLLQSAQLLDELGGRSIFCGDLNAEEHEPCIQLCRQRMQDAWRVHHPDEPGHTWVAANPQTGGYDLPDRRLDYVFCTRDLHVASCEIVLDEPDPVHPSDHFGVLAAIATT